MTITVMHILWRSALTLGLLVVCANASAASIHASWDEQMAELAQRPEVREAFSIIEALEPAAIDQLIELTEIPAPPFAESVRAKRILQMVRE